MHIIHVNLTYRDRTGKCISVFNVIFDTSCFITLHEVVYLEYDDILPVAIRPDFKLDLKDRYPIYL